MDVLVSCVALDEIKQRIQKQPDDVHEMPVKSGEFDGSLISAGKFSSSRAQKHHGQDSESDGDVNAVQAGHRPIKPEKNLCLRRQQRIKIGTGQKVVMQIFVIFKSFDDEKREAEQNRQREKRGYFFYAIFFGGVNSERHGKTAG